MPTNLGNSINIMQSGFPSFVLTFLLWFANIWKQHWHTTALLLNCSVLQKLSNIIGIVTALSPLILHPSLRRILNFYILASLQSLMFALLPYLKTTNFSYGLYFILCSKCYSIARVFISVIFHCTPEVIWFYSPVLPV